MYKNLSTVTKCQRAFSSFNAPCYLIYRQYFKEFYSIIIQSDENMKAAGNKKIYFWCRRKAFRCIVLTRLLSNDWNSKTHLSQIGWQTTKGTKRQLLSSGWTKPGRRPFPRIYQLPHSYYVPSLVFLTSRNWKKIRKLIHLLSPEPKCARTRADPGILRAGWLLAILC